MGLRRLEWLSKLIAMGLTNTIGKSERSNTSLIPGGTETNGRTASDLAREAMNTRFGETLFLADWVAMTFLHFRVEEDRLSRLTRFSPDLFEGHCHVSLVAFTMNRFRFRRGGRLTRWMTLPLSSHRFLNLRTYVHHEREHGILFLNEWLNHRLAVALGPRTFGLPYRLSRITSQHDGITSQGRIETENGCLEFHSRANAKPARVKPGTRSEHLLERYVAFTEGGRRPMKFRVWHPEWEVSPILSVDWIDTSLLENSGEGLFSKAEFIGGHLTAGIADVWMGRPHRVAI